ncbi:(+)-neomenthol dehydrogenase-like [Andrographis paniculata]|uniref:(+)-neomenthol dehydrogenase-like n=1 Tax=Andrographis paniculata TaxID=175694 RepID=UPI0021E7E001|nr:(+)-neomenthol dehydrogenase-like [Andrographis paniculata]XP_051146462.1 (+)-neomenthol dehydrogenase-like [Andrographis paniculata]
MAEEAQKYAVVTGANKGIGLETCRQLASRGITVVLTARDENKGREAVEKLEASGLVDRVIFHHLDVTDNSVTALVEFIQSLFGRLDILVNNAGIAGSKVEWEAIDLKVQAEIDWNKISTDISYESTKDTIETNYYGTKRITEALLPLLQLSNSPRIVNVSSTLGNLKYIPSEWARGILNDEENLTEERIDGVVNEFLKDSKEEEVEAKGWPKSMGGYMVSKAAMNAYTRILAKQYPSFRINCLCPGLVKTDITRNVGVWTAEEGAEIPVMLATLPDDGPTGRYFYRNTLADF